MVSLANTREVLYLVNRPANVASHQASVGWIDRAVALVRPVAGQITGLQNRSWREWWTKGGVWLADALGWKANIQFLAEWWEKPNRGLAGHRTFGHPGAKLSRCGDAGGT